MGRGGSQDLQPVLTKSSSRDESKSLSDYFASVLGTTRGRSWAELEAREAAAAAARDGLLRRIVDVSGNARYYNHEGHLHREDGPSAEMEDGALFWWLNGVRHRTDGPAVERSNGERQPQQS